MNDDYYREQYIGKLISALESIAKFADAATQTKEEPSPADWRDFARAQAELARKALRE